MPRHSNETDWIVQVNESLKAMPSDDQQHWRKRSIYKVPGRSTNLNREAYQPLAVSFGPYHYGQKHLYPMEEHKHRALLHFLKRSRKPLERFLKSLREVEEDLVASYEVLDKEWKKGSGEGTASRFLQLMITDGCFMLEILRSAKKKLNDYASNDPIFSKHGKLNIIPYIKRDMLLLENQLPMLVLDQLVAVCGGMKEDNYINRLILNFYFPSANNPTMGKCLHVLDVYRKSMLTETKKDKGKIEDSEKPILSATELHERGVQFKAIDTKCLSEVSFASGVLRLPKFLVNDGTESTFLNLIAFERSHVGAGNEVTSYICFMDNIIDKEKDVALLRTKGIIQNVMGSDEAAAKLFNSLAKDVMLHPDSSLRDVMNEVKEYSKKRRHFWKTIFKHTHCRNPVVILSFIGAVVLFGLTATETVYAALGYKK